MCGQDCYPVFVILAGCYPISMHNLRQRYLLACLQAYWQGRQMPEPVEPMDPTGLARLAIQQGVGPLLYRSLKAAPWAKVPERLAIPLRTHYLAAAAQAGLQVREVQRLQQAFEAAKLPLLFYKGVVLEQIAYGDPTLRPASDIDLLVAEADFARAESVLLNLGYQRDVLHQGVARWVHLKLQREHPYRTPDRLLMVDLHTGVAPRRFALQPSAKALWAKARWVDLAGQRVRTLSVEVLLPLLCLHSAKHQWRSLKWMCDVAGLLQRFGELEWDRVWLLAQHWQCLRMVRLGLRLVHEGLGVSLPPEVLQVVKRDRRVEKLAQHIWKGIDRPNVWRCFWPRFVFHVQCREHPAARLRYLLLTPLFYTTRPLLGIKH